MCDDDGFDGKLFKDEQAFVLEILVCISGLCKLSDNVEVDGKILKDELESAICIADVIRSSVSFARATFDVSQQHFFCYILFSPFFFLFRSGACFN